MIAMLPLILKLVDQLISLIKYFIDKRNAGEKNVVAAMHALESLHATLGDWVTANKNARDELIKKHANDDKKNPQ